MTNLAIELSLRTVTPLLVLEAGVLLASLLLLGFTLRWSGRTLGRLRAERLRRAEALRRDQQRVRELEEEAACSWPGYRKFQVLRRVDEDLAGHMASFELVPFRRAGAAAAAAERLPRFRPGQYVQVRVDIPGQANLLTRSYSLSQVYAPDRYRITVARAPGVVDPVTGATHPPGIVSSYFLEHVRERTVLDLMVPQGDFFLDPAGQGPVVLVGWGIHTAPLLCIFETVARAGGRDAWLFLEVPDQEALPRESLQPLLDLAQQGPSRLHVWISFAGHGAGEADRARDRSEDEGEDAESRPERDPASRDRPIVYRAGRQALPWVKRALPAAFKAQAEFYVSGPALMLREAKHDLESWGVPEDHVHFEVFDRESLDAITAVEDDGGACTVTFESSKKASPWDPEDRNLLGLAARAKVRIPSTCKIGKCGECAVLLVSGKVRYAKAPDFKVPQGHCLPCVATPASSTIVLGA